MHLALYAISRKAGFLAGFPKDRPAAKFRRAAFSCALALVAATAGAARADDTARGLIESNGVVRFNGFRIEQNTGRDPLTRGRALDQPPRAKAVIPTPRGAQQRVIVDMTKRYRPPEVTIPYLPPPPQTLEPR